MEANGWVISENIEEIEIYEQERQILIEGMKERSYQRVIEGKEFLRLTTKKQNLLLSEKQKIRE